MVNNMKKSILQNILSVILVLVALSAQADDGFEKMPGMKDLFLTALQQGSSVGDVQDNIADIFKNATQSNEPVHVEIKRIEQFEHGCGRLHAVFKQVVGRNDKGVPITVDPWFELNICPDGNPPAEKLKEAEAKQHAMLVACKASIEKLGQDKETGATRAVLHATGCPSGGAMSHWRYTGDCDDLMMPPGLSTNTPISKDGKIDVGLLIPAQCLTKRNVWSALIQNSGGLKVGEIRSSW